jgi:hypothetical protein
VRKDSNDVGFASKLENCILNPLCKSQKQITNPPFEVAPTLVMTPLLSPCRHKDKLNRTTVLARPLISVCHVIYNYVVPKDRALFNNRSLPPLQSGFARSACFSVSSSQVRWRFNSSLEIFSELSPAGPWKAYVRPAARLVGTTSVNATVQWYYLP